MNKITFKIVVHETDKPISFLQVHFYGVKEKTLPSAIMDESQWDKLYHTNWKGLTATRLGSAQTNSDGIISYEYDPSLVALPAKPEGLNLWYAVVGPEIAGEKTCPKVLHVGCDVRVNAGIHESYLIRIPTERLIRFGLGAGTAPKLSQSFTSRELYALMNNLSQAESPTKPKSQCGSFADDFIKRQKSLRADLKKKKLISPTQSAFSALLPMQTPEGKSPSKITQFLFDKKNKTFVITAENEPPRPISFEGLVRIDATNLKSLKQNSPAIQIEESSGKFKLALLKVPDSLRLSENEPDALYKYYRKNSLS